MGGGLVLLLLVAAESCWTAGASQGPAQGQQNALENALLENALESALEGDVTALRYGYYKRLPQQYNFGLGKRAASPPSKLYSFGLGKRAADYDENISSEDELSDDQLEDLMAKRSRVYGFGLGKRAKPYSFGLGKRAKAYSFGLGKRLPSGERRYAFGLGKRSDADLEEQADAGEYWQSSGSAIGKREVAAQELQAAGASPEPSPEPAAHSVLKRAARMQYSFGLGKRDLDDDVDVLDLEELEGMPRATRAKQYGFGLGKRQQLFRQLSGAGGAGGSAKRGSRQYGFGLGRRSMQYNFGIGKRSPTTEVASTQSPAAAAADR